MNSLNFLQNIASKTNGQGLDASEWNKTIQALIDGANSGFTPLQQAKVEKLENSNWTEVPIVYSEAGIISSIILDPGNTYRLSGYFPMGIGEGIHFDSTKQVASSTIILHNVFIKLVEEGTTNDLIHFNFEAKSLKVIIDANTENYIIGSTLLESACIHSDNNLEIAGTGFLGVYNDLGHGIKGSELDITGDVKIFANVGHDALHGTKIVNIQWGQYYIDLAKDAVGTGLQDPEDVGKLRGIIRVFGGKFYINKLTDNVIFDAKYPYMVYAENIYHTPTELSESTVTEDFTLTYVIHSGIFSRQNVSVECLGLSYNLFPDTYTGVNYFREYLVETPGTVLDNGVEVIAAEGIYTCAGTNIIVKGKVTGKIVLNTQSAEVHLQRAILKGDVVIEYTPIKKKPQIQIDKYSEASYIEGAVISANNLKLTPKAEGNLYFRNCEEPIQASEIDIVNGGGNIYIVDTLKGIKGTEYTIGIEEGVIDPTKIFSGNVYAFNNTYYSIHARLNSSGNKKGTITVVPMNEGTVYVDKVYIEKSIAEITLGATGKLTVEPNNGQFYYQTLTGGGFVKGAIKYFNKVSGILNTYFE